MPERQGQLFDQLDVPGRAERDRTGQGGRGIRRVETDPAHAGGTIGHDQPAQTDLRVVVQDPRVTTREQTDLLLQVEPSDKGGLIARNPDSGASHRLPPRSFMP